MVDDKEELITFDSCPYNSKYDSMGVTARELYFRQNKLCWLEAAYDVEGSDRQFGDLYCTDGTDYETTNSMLNPTFECAQCMTSFLKDTIAEMNIQRNLDAKLVKILTFIGKAHAQKKEDLVSISMLRSTFDSLEKFISDTVLFSPETNPLKVTASGDILMFGARVSFDLSMEEGVLLINPGNIILRL